MIPINSPGSTDFEKKSEMVKGEKLWGCCPNIRGQQNRKALTSCGLWGHLHPAQHLISLPGSKCVMEMPQAKKTCPASCEILAKFFTLQIIIHEQRGGPDYLHGAGQLTHNLSPLPFSNSSLSYAPQLSGAKFCFLVHLRSGRWLLLAFPQLLSKHRGGWQPLLDHSLGSLHSHWEARNH